jgi:hypothetical protein
MNIDRSGYPETERNVRPDVFSRIAATMPRYGLTVWERKLVPQSGIVYAEDILINLRTALAVAATRFTGELQRVTRKEPTRRDQSGNLRAVAAHGWA